MTTSLREAAEILDLPVDVLTYDTAASRICTWAAHGDSRYVCASNVHMLMEACDDPRFRRVLLEADLVTADGMPVVWSQRLLGHCEATRVYGPDLTLKVCEMAAEMDIPVGLYGSSSATLHLFADRLCTLFPALQVPFAFSPPFRPLTPDEDEQITRRIAQSGLKILLVGLGCPRQEFWMAEHRCRIPAVMLGVGAAFDFIAGTKPQSPGWMQRVGLEWSFRLITEPRRLWRRYAYHNPRFVLRMLRRLLLSQVVNSRRG